MPASGSAVVVTGGAVTVDVVGAPAVDAPVVCAPAGDAAGPEAEVVAGGADDQMAMRIYM